MFKEIWYGYKDYKIFWSIVDIDIEDKFMIYLFS